MAVEISSPNRQVEKKSRVAIVDAARCKPNECNLECARICPVNAAGKFCIEVEKTDIMAKINAVHCIGCGLCVKKCPFKAIKILNMPTNASKKTVHSYGINSFRLCGVPVPRRGHVLGLIGQNGSGKSTIINILSANIKPNLGKPDQPPGWDEILKNYRGSELMNFFQQLAENKIKAVTKPQHIDQMTAKVKPKATVKAYFDKFDARGVKDEVIETLEMQNLLTKEVKGLSGGELQRFCIGMIAMQNADIYIFDEPSSYLDVKQRVQMVKMIKSLCQSDKYVFVIEHDMAVVDYLADIVCIVYGYPSAYGFATLPVSCRDGINQYLDGYIKSDNMRIRDKPLKFSVTEDDGFLAGAKVQKVHTPA